MSQKPSLQITHPELVSEWHTVKNGELKPTDVTIGTHKKIWWFTPECGHTWDATPLNKLRMKGCPYCTPVGRKRLLTGFNDLATTHPEIASEWHPTKNGVLTPNKVLMGTGTTKRWWLGKDCNHEWEASAYSRARGRGCPYCVDNGRKRVLKGFSDLATKFPAIASEWHPTKNENVTPHSVTAFSNTKRWWLGKCGHSWLAPVDKRTIRGDGCTVCSGKTLLAGFNDLASQNPMTASEWHPTKNGNLKASEVNSFSHKGVWWQCQEGHEWKTPPYARLAGNGCPQCALNQTSSSGEEDVRRVIELIQPNAILIHSARSVIRGELDIYVPEKNLAVEFNGLYWHSEATGKDHTYHEQKSQACAEKGIHLIHVWEDDWRDRRDIVVRALAHRLNATERLNTPGALLTPDPSLTQRYGARTLSAEVITHTESSVFLEANHIQGKANGTIHTGLRDKEGILRAVFVAKRVGNKGREGEWRIERYATRGIVPGGFTKLMKFTVGEICNPSRGNPQPPQVIDKWVTFSDGALSDGGLYRNYGFVEDGLVRPDYQYVVKGQRVHKFNYRLKRFRDDPNLKYEEGLSERELALLNNIPRIWDSGKTRWIKAP